MTEELMYQCPECSKENNGSSFPKGNLIVELEDEVLEVDLDQSLECGNVSLGRVAIYISGKGKKNKFYIPYSAISKGNLPLYAPGNT